MGGLASSSNRDRLFSERIRRERGQNIRSGESEPPKINIVISKENGKIKLDCQVIVATALVDAVEMRKSEMNIFLEALNKNLKK
jgi:hypothetical protein